MIPFFGNLAFLNPWALAALLALPALYFLLRVTPPSPQTIRFPATRLLVGLKPKQNTPSHTPWWILLLRMLMAALLLLALARPVLNPITESNTSGPLRLVIDSDWAAAQNWDNIIRTAEEHITRAGRQGHEIYIYTTAGSDKTQNVEPQSAGDALATLKALKPMPWFSELRNLQKAIKAGEKAGHTIWFSGGLHAPGSEILTRTLAADGNLQIYTPDADDLPFILKATKNITPEPAILVEGARNAEFKAPLRVQLLGPRGQILDEQAIETADQKFPVEVRFDLPESLRAQAASFKIAGHKGAQARYLLSGHGGPKSVGIVAPEEASQTGKLIEDSFYLNKALEPYATLHTGTLSEVLEQKPSMIILPDIGAMPSESLNALDEWVRGGGLLLRFAGPNMTEANRQIPLTPVPLRRDARTVQGSLSWDKPLKIQPLEPESPLYGLGIDEDIEISGQILPEPSVDLADTIWAQLEDGTPLVTAKELDSGLLVMLHTTASPTWSNLPLTGLYVGMLRRLLKFAGQSGQIKTLQDGLLQPSQIMDGFGTLNTPGPQVKPINSADFETTKPSPDHPPGLYGHGPLQRPFNLGEHIEYPKVLEAPESTRIEHYGESYEQDLTPALLIAAALLFLFDALVMLILSIGLQRFRIAALLSFTLIGFSSPALAQDANPANGLYLAYIKTDQRLIDSKTQKGLEVLAQVLTNRTSVEPQGVKALDPERDTLAFFPIIYWTITPGQKTLSSKALANLQSYLDHGGTILLDTQDGKKDSQHLRRLIGDLNIAPLTELPEDHVLTKSFYLLKFFPGRYEGRPLWVEAQSASGRDGVSSVILGSNDWTGAWAELNIIKRGNRGYISGATEHHEHSLRFGVNLVMYALTGNYKADQVHVPHILRRLGK